MIGRRRESEFSDMNIEQAYDKLSLVSASKTAVSDSKNAVREGSLRKALASRVVIADGAMGTMIQSANPSLSDFQNLEGCNEVLNVTRPELIADIHRQYFQAGVDAVETNTFGANLANLLEYEIPERIYELAEAGARIARKVADEFSAKTSEPKWVLGSLGPGTKLPTLGHATYEELKHAYADASRGLIDGGVDALLIETTQDLLQAKAAVNGARQAIAATDRDIVLIAQVTVETTGTMLLGSEIGAALNSLGALGVDLIGMNCATGPSEMSEHLRSLSQSSPRHNPRTSRSGCNETEVAPKEKPIFLFGSGSIIALSICAL